MIPPKVAARIAHKCTAEQGERRGKGYKIVLCEVCENPFWKHVRTKSRACCECRAASAWKKRAPEPYKGFPKAEKFQTLAQIEKYLSGDRIKCLLCGHRYAGLGRHIAGVHGMSVREYKFTFGIPLTYSIAGTSVQQHCRRNIKQSIKAGRIKTTADRPHGERIRARSTTYTSMFHAPALRKAAGKHLNLSKNHIAKSRKKLMAYCSACGNEVGRRSEISVVCHSCKILCNECKNVARKANELRWLKSFGYESKSQYMRDYYKRVVKQRRAMNGRRSDTTRGDNARHSRRPRVDRRDERQPNRRGSDRLG